MNKRVALLAGWTLLVLANATTTDWAVANDSADTHDDSCEALCLHQAQVLYGRCLAEGGSAEDCKSKAEAAYRDCADGCSDAKPVCNEDDDSCAQRCEKSCKSDAQDTYERCIADGGNEKACKSQGQRVYARCASSCAAPPSCADKCEKLGNRVLQQCLRDGGDETEDGGGSGAPAGVCGCPHTVVAAAAAAVKPFGAFGHVDGVADGDSRKWSSRARCCLCSFASRF